MIQPPGYLNQGAVSGTGAVIPFPVLAGDREARTSLYHIT